MTKKRQRSQAPTATPVESAPRRWGHYAIIAAVAVILRVVYDFEVSRTVFFGNYVLDSLTFHNWALSILAGDPVPAPFFRAPLYPYLIAAVYGIFGVSPWPVVIVQNLLGVATALITYRFAQRLLSPRWALAAGIITAAYPTLIFNEAEMMMTALEVFLCLAAVFAMHVALEQPSLRRLLTAGLLAGLACITRPTFLPLVGIFPLVYLVRHGWHNWSGLIRHTVLMAIGVLVPILPVTATNVVAGHELFLISSQGGVNFYMGNSATADGITVQALGPQRRTGKYVDNVWTSSIDEAERRLGRKLTQSEVSAYWYSQAWNEIKARPLRAAGLFFRKLYLHFHGQEIINFRSYYYPATFSKFMKLTVWKHGLNSPSGLLFPLALAGVVAAWNRRKELAVLFLYFGGLSLILAAFFVCARFRQPLVPAAAILAVVGVNAVAARWHNERRWCWTIIGLAVLLTVILNLGGDVESPVNRSQYESLLGSYYKNRGDYDSAATHLEASLAISQDNGGAFATLGEVYLRLHRVDDAERVYREGVQRFPENYLCYFGLGRAAHLRRDFEQAKQQYRSCLQYAPDFAPAYEYLGEIFDQQKSVDSALCYYQHFLQLYPSPKVEQRVKALGGSLPNP